MTSKATNPRLTFEAIQKYMRDIDVDSLREEQTILPENLQDRLRHLAVVHGVLRPVLLIVRNVRILPRRWRRGLDVLNGAIEAVLLIADAAVPAAGGDREDFKAGRDLEQFKAGRDLEE